MVGLAAFQEPAPVLEGGQEGQGGQRIGDSCDGYDRVDTLWVVLRSVPGTAGGLPRDRYSAGAGLLEGGEAGGGGDWDGG